MHCSCDFFRFWPLPALSLASAAPTAHAAQLLTTLYGAVVADADAQQAAQGAMRLVLVRLTGARDAASDPALAGLVSDARRYVQRERSTTVGTTQVLFEAGALREAIGAAGRSVWGPDRPLVWVWLPPWDGAAAQVADGRWTGGPELAIDATTDALVRASRDLDAASVADRDCHVSGVADLPSFASVISALRATPEVTEVAVREVDADSLRLQLKVRGNEAEIGHALANDRLRATARNAPGALEYRYQAPR
jgi:hypothetical protein